MRTLAKALTLSAALALPLTGGVAVAEEQAASQESGKSQCAKPVKLLDGANPMQGWHMAGPGSFSVEEHGVIETQGGMGLLWYEAEKFEEYTLHLDFRLLDESNNSGVFVGFPDPGDDPWVAVTEGEEIQINDNPGGDPQKTGAVYNEKPAATRASNPIGEWNHYKIVVRDDAITVHLNGTQVNHWVDDDPRVDLSEGYIGLQNHPPTSVQFRHARVHESCH
ncbi:3-keto-disaccharide hydrolase [Haloactinomyces albus]|uniref:3-keto-alpha-glucoside-1,2-lyase/3-keto-2-hydroxy-glucal hydratase domain-containing protein n=1 Tax=Haloactinomyces albus TaxID=1352928 RepID=A0AAE3ZJ76_9ACTN|nr:DUF1080 domain-containing protein [Haloactinomyces albus]MDR7304177.1 hypothetical protein [Haloactinomyces albus]